MDSTVWRDVLALDGDARVQAMGRRLEALTALDEDARRAALSDLATMIFALPDVELRAATEARLRGLLTLDDAAMRCVAASFDAVVDGMHADVAMRRVAVVQHVARDLSADDRRRLHGLEPGILADAPVSLVAHGTSRPKHETREAPAHLADGVAPRSPWRAFWRGRR